MATGRPTHFEKLIIRHWRSVDLPARNGPVKTQSSLVCAAARNTAAVRARFQEKEPGRDLATVVNRRRIVCREIEHARAGRHFVCQGNIYQSSNRPSSGTAPSTLISAHVCGTAPGFVGPRMVVCRQSLPGPAMIAAADEMRAAVIFSIDRVPDASRGPPMSRASGQRPA